MTISSNGKLLIRVPNEHFEEIKNVQFSYSIFTENLKQPTDGLTGLTGVTEPLFPDEANNTMLKGALDFTKKSTWLLHSPTQRIAINPWDKAHQIYQQYQDAKLAGDLSDQVYIEPDLEHFISVTENDDTQRKSLTVDGKSTENYPVEPLNTHYPPTMSNLSSLDWYIKRDNFDKAWAAGYLGQGIRIAHVDTGYSDQHQTKPLNLLPEQGWNYYDNNADTVDPGNHLNAGHGPATLAILAGNKITLNIKDNPSLTYSGYIGGAPEASVVPIRIGGVGGSVAHIYSSNLAQGLKHALGTYNTASGQYCPPCNVVTLSHGGLPTASWADVTNQLYDQGIVLVAASGDSYNAVVIDIATHFTVYPSAFWRVITATGVTYDNKPYITNDAGVMQGSWGPDAVMKKAVAASTPNVPWMKLGSTNGWALDGGGTSASTPQIAAACALWLQKNKAALAALEGWQKVEACRFALFGSVANKNLNLKQIGLGTLDVNAMLSMDINQIVAKVTDPKFEKIGPDKVSFPFWRLLFGLAPPQSGREEMYEVEAHQLLYRSKNTALQEAYEQYSEAKDLNELSPQLVQELREQFLQEPDMSMALRSYLKANLNT